MDNVIEQLKKFEFRNNRELSLMFEAIDLGFTLIHKNREYGNSFENQLNKYGDLSLIIRLNDKMERLEALIKTDSPTVYESFNDTVLDIAGYAILKRAIERRKQIES